MRFLSILILLIFLVGSCKPEEALPGDAPPIAGFGSLTRSFDANTGTEAVLLLNKPVSAPLRLEFVVGGNAIRGIDYELPNEGFFLLQPENTEAYLKIIPLPTQRDIENKILTLTLKDTPGITLAEGRRTLTLSFLNAAHTVKLSLWAKDVAFPQLFGYTSFGPEPVADGRGGEHFCFAYKSSIAPNVIGFYHQDSSASTNAFNMHRIYAAQNITSASARVRIPQALRFSPDAPGAKTGTVEVIRQDVTLRRTAASGQPPFKIPIWGMGRYSEITGTIFLDVHFDESEIGGPKDVLRKFIYEKERRPQ
jgi:hypothetical protein